MRSLSMICARWSSRRRGAIRNRRCCGPARACASSPEPAATWAIRSAARWSASSCTSSTTRLQANRKTREGSHHPDRDAQFHYINDRVKQALAAGEPAISVDTKKKELVGDFKNAGREWRPQGSPEEVRVHDFVIPELGRAVPYGVYDIADNAGWVSVGIDHDTAAFAANAIRRWWKLMGRERYPNATQPADHRRWRRQQRLARPIVEGRAAKARRRASACRSPCCHLPPGTSKWNKIEHRLFSFITGNWRGKPLVSHQVIVATDRRNDDEDRPEGSLRTRSKRSIQPASRCPTPKSQPSISPVTTSMANGTILSAQKPSPWSDSSRTGP